MTVGGQYGKMKKRTLENYCHNKVATAANRLHQGCFLYETKTENMGMGLKHAVETAEEFRAFKELGILPPLTEISAFEYSCLDSAERAINKVNNELSKKANKPDKKNNPALPSGIGDSGPKRTGGPR